MLNKCNKYTFANFFLKMKNIKSIATEKFKVGNQIIQHMVWTSKIQTVNSNNQSNGRPSMKRINQKM